MAVEEKSTIGVLILGIKEGKFVYKNGINIPSAVETLADSVFYHEGLLTRKFPYGSIGVGNQLAVSFEKENTLLKTANDKLRMIIELFPEWLPKVR